MHEFNPIKELPTLHIDGKPFAELLALFMIAITEDTEYYDVLAFNLLKTDYQKTLSLFDDFDNLRKGSIISAMGQIQKPDIEVENFVVPFLAHHDDYVAIQALYTLLYADNDYLDEVKPLFDHPNARLRAGAITYYGKRLKLAYKDELINHLTDPHPLIRQSALDELDEMADLPDDELIAIISPYLNDPDPQTKELVEYIINSRK